jgi:TetR/AcrR family fatty acid metabolism transcriptional regulator
MTAHSSRSPGRRDDAKGKRVRILEAAEKAFARRGFYNARISEIASEAGVADGTIYLYFKSKDDLLISWFEWRMERVVLDLEDAVAGAASASDKVAAFIEAHLEMVAANPAAAEVLTVELRQSTKFMKEYSAPMFGEFLKLLAGIIAEGQKTGELDSEVPAPLAARAIFGAIDELALAWLLGSDIFERSEKTADAAGGEPPKFDIVRTARWATRIVLTGMQKQGAPK